MKGKGKLTNHYDDNRPNCNDPSLIQAVEHFHTNDHSPKCKAYKILGVHIDEQLTFDFFTQYMISSVHMYSRSLYPTKY